MGASLMLWQDSFDKRANQDFEECAWRFPGR